MGIDPLRAAARALTYWERRQEIASNNVANTETPGFKRQRVFAELLDGEPVVGVTDDLSPGLVRDTGRPLDVALSGDGFLVVDGPGGEMLRRGGSLSLDASGVLVDGGGRPVLSEDGVVVLPPGDVSIDRSGVVSVNGDEVARLRVETAQPAALRRVEAGLWTATATARVRDEGRMLRQGALEESNYDALQGLVEMVEVQRGYASVQKTVTTLDDVLGIAANRLGRLG